MFSELAPGPIIDWRSFLLLLFCCLILALAVTIVMASLSPRSRLPLARAFSRRSLRASVILTTVLVSTVPALTMAVVLAERAANLRNQQIETRLADTARAAALGVDSFLDKHLAGVTSAANAITAENSSGHAAMSRWLGLYHNIYGDFLTMLATDRAGNIVTATSLVNGVPAAIAELTAQNVADRSYFIEPMRDNAPFISHVFQGRGLGSDPIVAVSAPLRDAQGQPRGVIEGSLNLRTFADVERRLPSVEHAVMLILDERSRVIYASSSARAQILQPATEVPDLVDLLDAARSETGMLASSNAVGAMATTANQWQVVVSVPTAFINRQTSVDYALAAILVGLAVVMALVMTAALARQVGRAVGALNRAVKAFSLEGDGETFKTPLETPAEFRPVLDHMRKRSQQIRKSHERLKHSIATGEALSRQLNRAISEKETEIDERTRDLKETNERLHTLSRRDALTGIANRRHFEAFEQRMRRMCQRDDQAMTIIMIDIDFFKPYNDNLGHEQGDMCLRTVAEALESCAQRPLDLVARFGGEEFIAVLGSTPVADGCIVAERMRRTIQCLGIEHPTSTHGVVTISVGVGGGKISEPHEPNLFRRMADEALYAAKAGGRNCVYIAGDNGNQPYTPAPDGNEVLVAGTQLV